MLRQFEQKIEENSKPTKKTIERHTVLSGNNAWKSKNDSNVKAFESVDNKLYTNNEETVNNNDKTEALRKNIVADISKTFQTGHSYENEINNNYSEEEFDRIESTFHEMENTILEMQAAHRIQHKQQGTHCTLTSKNNTKHKPTKKDSSSFREDFQLDKRKNDEKDRDSLSEDMYYVIVDETYQDRDEEFGKSNFESLEDINFVEAYNRRGSELILTQVGQILRRSISQDRSSSTLNFLHKQFPEETLDRENENEKFNQTTSETEYPPGEVKVHSGLETANYFSGRDVINSKKNGSETTDSEVSSNRSTLYSVSEYNDEDFSDVDVREKVVTFDQGIRRETYYNSQKNPVIEKICNLESCHMNHGESHYDINSLGRERKKSKEKRKIDYLAEELLYSEKKYISDLEKIITDYVPFLINEETIPHHLIAKAHIVFGNIKAIYSKTKDFYNDLKDCAEIPELIADTFLKHENLFQMYPIYYKNKPRADYYLTKEFRSDIIARQKHLGDRLGLASYLLTPVQRLGKYILLLEQIQKELTQEGTPSNKIQKAIEMVRKQMSRGNDFLAIDSIKESPVNLAQQGSFIMREKFNIIKPRKFEAMLFLFEEIVVITSPDTVSTYTYGDSSSLFIAS
ncbi:triple functional domain protein-like isoform X2 [Agrilus planipennis]|nr:triple functional domain protein-like isoform X2 [Agrilus planipennis]